MSKYRKTHTSMWADGKFRALSPLQPSGQALWMWLLVGPRTCNIPGVVVGSEAVLAAELGWPTEAFRKAFREASSKGMAKADPGGLIWLPNGVRYNRPESPNVVRSWRATWDDVPECSLKNEAWHALKAFTEGLGEGFGKAFGEACAQPSPNQEQEQEQEQEKDIPASAPDGAGTLLQFTLAPPTPPEVTPDDLALVYASYPRKRGRADGLKVLAKDVKTQADLALVKQALANFCREVAKWPQDKIRHFDRWARTWRDYLEPSGDVRSSGIRPQEDDFFARRAREREAKLVEVNRMRAEVGLEPVSRV